MKAGSGSFGLGCWCVRSRRLRRTRVVVARKTGGSETPPLRQETEKTAGWGWVLHPGGGSTRGAGYGPPAHHERLQRPGWLLEGVVRHGPVRQAQGRLSEGLRPGSPRTVVANGDWVPTRGYPYRRRRTGTLT